MTRRLVAGPCAGELGWELCAWIPRLRYVARAFDAVHVFARGDRAHLYADIPACHVEPIRVREDSANFLDGELEGELPPLPSGQRFRPTGAMVALERAAFRNEVDRRANAAGKAWHLYGGRCGEGELADVCVALRRPKAYRGQLDERKAYPDAHGRELVERLIAEGLRVAVVGGRDNRTALGAIDLRGRPLEQQCAALGAAAVCVGPSSGPLHLAQLCGTAVVTWYNAPEPTRQGSLARYRTVWNPFHAPVSYLGPEPKPAEVAAAVLEQMGKR